MEMLVSLFLSVAFEAGRHLVRFVTRVGEVSGFRLLNPILAIVLALSAAAPVHAHVIPEEVVVEELAKPAGNHFYLLVHRWEENVLSSMNLPLKKENSFKVIEYSTHERRRLVYR